MGVLGKDLLDFHRPRTNTKVEFGASGYWVESHPTMQPYGAVLTEILNLDAAPFQELLDQYRNAVVEKDAEQAARAFQAVTNGFASLPLYRLYWNDVQLFASMDVRELFVGEAQEAFREYVMQDDTLPRFMQEQLDAIRLIQERYAWFLDGIFAGDPEVSTREQEYIRHFCTTGELCLPVALRPGYETLYDRTFTCRPDSPKGLVRYQESRLYSCFGSTVPITALSGQQARRSRASAPASSTGRYSGEIQLVRADLPADEKVNVIGEVPAEYDLLLDCIKRGKTFRMVKTS